MPTPDSTVFVNWIHFHGRSDGLARHLGVESVYFESEGNVLSRYVRQWRATVKYLRQRQPDQIIVMQPPVVSLLAIRLGYRPRHLRIASDLHTGVFSDKKWSWAVPLVLQLTGKSGAMIVTNPALAARVTSQGHRALVVHDLIESIPHDTKRGQHILVPLAYAHDEPLSELLEAARRNPSIEWRLTGRAPEWMRAAAPANVRFLGFLSNDDYWTHFESARAIAALTTEEDTMQRAAYEALSRGKALIVSDTAVLRDYYAGSAVLTRPTATGISTAAATAIEEADKLERAMSALRERKLAEQADALSELEKWLFPGERTR